MVENHRVAKVLFLPLGRSMYLVSVTGARLQGRNDRWDFKARQRYAKILVTRCRYDRYVCIDMISTYNYAYV